MTTSNPGSPTIAILPSAANFSDQAEYLARRLSIPRIKNETTAYDFLLICSDAGLALKQTGNQNLGPVRISFTSPAMTYRIKHGGGRRQALARAIGLKKGWQPTVIDATAGLGRDGFILACLGCMVHLLERSPILAAMLEDALLRAENSELTAEVVKNRLRLSNVDSSDFLQHLNPEEYPEVIYLDPMYPERTKSSLVKKEMRVLRGLTGNDQDAGTLLNTALTRVRNRVVVKRPRLAPILGSLKPTHQIKGKSSRFDVYLV